MITAGTKVVCAVADETFPGVVLDVNDADQGDFEFRVLHDDGTVSFWPRECLQEVAA